jgi:hypothetical protein
MDFWAGPAEPGDNWLRLRRADISLDWKNRSFSVGQDKPLISPYQPSSLAQVGIPPLADSGNLWLWLPQAKYEERVRLPRNNGITGQIALIQTDDTRVSVPARFSQSLAPARPGFEARLAFWHRFAEGKRLEVAPGFHASTTHVAGSSINSRIGSLDWFFNLVPHLEISGTVYHGQNVAGLGAHSPGLTISPDGTVLPVHSTGGWTQFAFPITNRLTLNVFGGFEHDSGTYFYPTDTLRNFSYASNLMYHLGPNVVVGVEGQQLRARSLSGTNELRNHYDVAIGYLF